MSVKNNNALFLLFFISIMAFATLSCVNKKQEQSLLDYDLDKPEKYNMPKNLFEISGLTFHNGDPKQVFAIQDEEGKLFQLGLGDPDAKSTKFGGKGDYEDLTIIKNHVVVLKSNGDLHIFPLSDSNQAEAGKVTKTKDLVPKAEYEGLAADEQSGMVYILTKDSKADSKNKNTSIYAFKFGEDASLQPGGTFHLSYQEIAALSGDQKIKFRPSALAKNPLTKEWYILSSINKLLLVTDEAFKIKAAYPLKGSSFNQPEGIAFDKDHNLYISNEGGDLSDGNILMFKHKKS